MEERSLAKRHHCKILECFTSTIARNRYLILLPSHYCFVIIYCITNNLPILWVVHYWFYNGYYYNDFYLKYTSKLKWKTDLNLRAYKKEHLFISIINILLMVKKEVNCVYFDLYLIFYFVYNNGIASNCFSLWWVRFARSSPGYYKCNEHVNSPKIDGVTPTYLWNH